MKLRNVLFMGMGDVALSTAIFDGDSGRRYILLLEPDLGVGKIGGVVASRKEGTRLDLGALPDTSVIMDFANMGSVDVIIEALLKVKKDIMLDKEEAGDLLVQREGDFEKFAKPEGSALSLDWSIDVMRVFVEREGAVPQNSDFDNIVDVFSEALMSFSGSTPVNGTAIIQGDTKELNQIEVRLEEECVRFWPETFCGHKVTARVEGSVKEESVCRAVADDIPVECPKCGGVFGIFPGKDEYVEIRHDQESTQDGFSACDEVGYSGNMCLAEMRGWETKFYNHLKELDKVEAEKARKAKEWAALRNLRKLNRMTYMEIGRSADIKPSRVQEIEKDESKATEHEIARIERAWGQEMDLWAKIEEKR